jgi:uncharacterized NAD(P)/FAD-binding protein YdhS
MQRIAIVGGGAAGAAVVGELLRNTPRVDAGSRTLTWFVGDRLPGRGVAYATIDDQHLLNARAANMGLFVDKPGDFLDYVVARGVHAHGAQFLPRALYGDYVEATLATLLARARASQAALVARSTEAIAIRPLRDDRFGVHTRDGDEVRVDHVVIALGALPSATLAVVSDRARDSGAYATDPWRWPTLAQPPAHVLVIGTGLSAVDMLLSAAARWPNARLTAVSRHGRLPATHAELPGPLYADRSALVQRLHERPRTRDWLRAILDITREPAADWRSLIDTLRHDAPMLWQALDLHERRRFLRHLRRHWEVARHRLPPQTAAALHRLRDDGRLRVIAARVRAVDGSGPLQVHLQARASTRALTLAADFVVQATGLDSDVATTSHALMRQLVDDGLVLPDPLGLGLAARVDGRLLRPDGSAWSGLHAIGTLLQGSVWECTGMPEIRSLARTIVDDLDQPARVRSREPVLA